MSNGAIDPRKDNHSAMASAAGNSQANGAVPTNSSANLRLRLNPNTDHNPERYDGLELEFNPLLYSSLERYLPPTMLGATRNTKAYYMRQLLLRYAPDGERTRVSIFSFLIKFVFF